MISYFVRINADLNKKIRIGPFPKLTDLLRSVWIREGEGLREWSVLISSRGERVNSFGACEMTSLARYGAKTAATRALSLSWLAKSQDVTTHCSCSSASSLKTSAWLPTKSN